MYVDMEYTVICIHTYRERYNCTHTHIHTHVVSLKKSAEPATLLGQLAAAVCLSEAQSCCHCVHTSVCSAVCMCVCVTGKWQPF